MLIRTFDERRIMADLLTSLPWAVRMDLHRVDEPLLASLQPCVEYLDLRFKLLVLSIVVPFLDKQQSKKIPKPFVHSHLPKLSLSSPTNFFASTFGPFNQAQVSRAVAAQIMEPDCF